MNQRPKNKTNQKVGADKDLNEEKISKSNKSRKAKLFRENDFADIDQSQHKDDRQMSGSAAERQKSESKELEDTGNATAASFSSRIQIENQCENEMEEGGNMEMEWKGKSENIEKICIQKSLNYNNPSDNNWTLKLFDILNLESTKFVQTASSNSSPLSNSVECVLNCSAEFDNLQPTMIGEFLLKFCRILRNDGGTAEVNLFTFQKGVK